MPTQLGFIYDESRCVRCRTCETACKTVRGIEPGLSWRKLSDTWTGTFPDVKRSFLSLSCMHCAEPACKKACSAGAITKNQDGLVLVNVDLCNGCGECVTACPYHIPQINGDGKMQKCDFCSGIGEKPICAVHCPTGALQFGEMNDLPETGPRKAISRYPGPTGPSLHIIKLQTGAREEQDAGKQ